MAELSRNVWDKRQASKHHQPKEKPSHPSQVTALVRPDRRGCLQQSEQADEEHDPIEARGEGALRVLVQLLKQTPQVVRCTVS